MEVSNGSETRRLFEITSWRGRRRGRRCTAHRPLLLPFLPLPSPRISLVQTLLQTDGLAAVMAGYEAASFASHLNGWSSSAKGRPCDQVRCGYVCSQGLGGPLDA